MFQVARECGYTGGGSDRTFGGRISCSNQGGAHAGQTAVVFGAGCIGLVSMMALKAEGVSRVYVVDIMQKRLDKAMELGATGVINSMNTDVQEEIGRLTEGKGVDLVIETAGMEVTTVRPFMLPRKVLQSCW